jgi:hypothetical protein
MVISLRIAMLNLQTHAVVFAHNLQTGALCGRTTPNIKHATLESPAPLRMNSVMPMLSLVTLQCTYLRLHRQPRLLLLRLHTHLRRHLPHRQIRASLVKVPLGHGITFLYFSMGPIALVRAVVLLMQHLTQSKISQWLQSKNGKFLRSHVLTHAV